jgi:hypothetical protein
MEILVLGFFYSLVEAVEKVVLERFVGYTGAITAGRG